MSQPVWPTLKEQFTRDKVNPDSALAKLIRENQDFHLLRPEEASDWLGLPLWLRVYWRKKHPEGHYSATDPTGGYPRVLRNVHKWMVIHQYLRPWRSSSQAVSPRGAEEEILGANLRISGAQIAPRSESDIRVNYNNPQQLIAASNAIDLIGTQAQFYSSNGGRTWNQSRLPLTGGTEDSLHSDPVVDWTSVGTAWAVTVGIDAAELTLQLRAYRSADGGATWTFDGTVSGRQTATDREMMWIDHSATSPHKDNIYVIWHNGQPVFVSRRTGPAGAWQAPVRVSGTETAGTGMGADIKTNGVGDVFAFWPDTVSRRVLVAKSTDGGATFAAPVTIAKTFAAYEIIVPGFASRHALMYVSGGAYRAATQNCVYAVWVDLTGAGECTTAAGAPGTNVSSPCTSRIWFTRSTNGGLTWEPPRMINHQAARNDQFNPRLAVDETRGQLLVVYYDTVNDPGRLRTDLWCQTSFDDGVSWSFPLKVTTAETDETAPGADVGHQYGDYVGLTGYGGMFWPSWTDRRAGGPEEIWTADIAAVPNAAVGSALAGFTLGSSQHVFYLGGDNHVHELRWDPAGGWRETDLMTAAADGAPSAAVGSALAGYVRGSVQHVFYLGADRHVHELWWDPASGWRAVDLMTAVAGGAPNAAVGSALAGYPLGVTQHVFYLGGDNHVHELRWDPAGGWHQTDLMTAAVRGAPNAAVGSALIGYPLGNSPHAFYVGTAGHVHELWWDPASGWRPTDLMTAIAESAPNAAVGGALAGYPLDNSQHVFYVGTDNHVHDLWWDRASGWRPTDLMTAAARGAPDAAVGSALAGYPLGHSQHVFYVGTDNHVHELWWDRASGWHPTDLVAAVARGAPDAVAGSALIGYPLGNTPHVLYAGTDRFVHGLGRDPASGWLATHLVLAV